MSPSAEPKVPRKRDTGKRRETTRQAILDAALYELADRNYFNVSTRDIARRARMATGLAYRYFIGKEELVATLVDRAADEWWSAIHDHLAAETTTDLRDFIVNLVMFLRERLATDKRGSCRFYLRHLSLNDFPLRERIRAKEVAWRGIILSRVEAARQNGRLNQEAESSEVRALLEMLLQYWSKELLDDLPQTGKRGMATDVEEMKSRVARTTQAALRGVLRPTTATRSATEEAKAAEAKRQAEEKAAAAAKKAAEEKQRAEEQQLAEEKAESVEKPEKIKKGRKKIDDRQRSLF